MVSSRPKRRKGRVVDVVVEGGPGLAPKQAPRVRLPQNPLKSFISALPGLLIGLGIVAVSVFVILNGTIMSFPQVGDYRPIVTRGGYPIGYVPAGKIVYASATKPDRTFIGKIEQGLFPSTSDVVATILAAPSQTIENDDAGKVVVDGNATAYTGTVDPGMLEDQYLAYCHIGGCPGGTNLVFIPQGNVIGEVRSWVGEKPQGIG